MHLQASIIVGLFFIYSFLGWILETIVATVKQRHLVNRGLVSGPLCILYGIAALIMSFAMHGMTGFWLFLFSIVYGTVIEWIAGHLIEKLYHKRWWDYSDIKWNLDGYICLPVSLVWGALGFVVLTWGNRFFIGILKFLPAAVIELTSLVALVILFFDVVASFIILRGNSKHQDKWEKANDQIAGISKRLGKWIARRIGYRIEKAYPKSKENVEEVVCEKEVFAQGCSFYKIICLFFIGAFLGDIVETIFCRITAGVWMSRSSVVWGPFSIVWGLGIAGVTAILYRYTKRGEAFLFWLGTLLGGAFEYLCSVFTEVVFGKIFWDYSKIPFNLGGRINLLFCFFWGIAAVVWFKLLYPKLSNWIEKLPMRFGKIVTWCFIVFMLCNVAMSSLALLRYDERSRDIPAEKTWQTYMDEHYDDTKMEKIYPNAKKADAKKIIATKVKS